MGDDRWPEHEKMLAVKGRADEVGSFIDWLLEQEDDEIAALAPEYVPSSKAIEKTIAAYLGIDLQKIAEEKDAMYRELRHQAQVTETIEIRKELAT